MAKTSKIELTKVHYYDSKRFDRNVYTISRQIHQKPLHQNPIIKRNIFGHRWVLKVNETNSVNKNKCGGRVVVYVLVFCCIAVAVCFGIYFSLESVIGKYVNINTRKMYPNKWNATRKIWKTTSTFMKINEQLETTKEEIVTQNINNENTTQLHVCSKCLYHDEVCLKYESKPICVRIKDKKDPTGCGGLCKINTQHCRIIDPGDGLYECQENKNVLKCPQDSFNCGNMCVAQQKRCDGIINCSNKSDEMNCPCNLSTHFQCGNMTSCIENRRKCDGILDCWDRSDEFNCHIGCQEDEIPCKNKQCIKSEQFCDGVTHCVDKSDEPRGCQK